MSAKKLAQYQAEHGKMPFSTITGKRKAVRKKSGKQRRVMGREKLYGAEKTARRREIFERSGGYCEATIERAAGPYKLRARCNTPITWRTFEWSHKRHAANKDDSLEGGIASCRECHRAQHNPKPITVTKKSLKETA